MGLWVFFLFWAEKAFSGLKSMGLGEVECNER